jgi:hypothetical protein
VLQLGGAVGWYAERTCGDSSNDFQMAETELAIILCAVRWYLRYLLSLRDVEDLLEERGWAADHTTVWRWVQRYGPELIWCSRESSKNYEAPIKDRRAWI